MVQKHSQISSPFANFADHPLVWGLFSGHFSEKGGYSKSNVISERDMVNFGNEIGTQGQAYIARLHCLVHLKN